MECMHYATLLSVVIKIVMCHDFLVQLLLGLHCRAAGIVALLTWFSLYVGWGSYMNIGSVDNFHRYVPM